MARHRLPDQRDPRNEEASLRIQAQKQGGARSSDAGVSDLRPQEVQRLIKSSTQTLVFPNESDRPDNRHEFKLKRIAFRAKMNCGQCVSKHGNNCAEGPYCSNFFLHKFRHTFCNAEFAGSRLRHKDVAALDGPQGLGINNGLFESCSQQGRDRSR
jgi:hypothetical protein